MLEFYPMPTNLNHGASLYPHQQNHGGARFLDNPATQNINTMTHQQQQQHLQQQQQQTNSQQQMIASPSQAACPPQNHNNSLNTCSIASLTAQTSCLAAATTTSNDVNPETSNTTSSSSSSSLSSGANSNSTSLHLAISNSKHQQQSSSSNCSTTPQQHSTSAIPASNSSLAPSTASTTSSNNCSNSATLLSSCSKLSLECNGRTGVDQIKCEKNFEVCEGCGQKIHDRYLMNVGDTNWHENCLACCYCGMQLHQTCYMRNGKLYCKMDYERLFSFKCAACCHPILPQDMVMRPLPNLIFHLSCFVCVACRIPLQKGEQFLLRDGQIICFRHDLEKEMFLAAAAAQHCGYLGLDEDELMRPRDGRRGPKRPRTILTSQQRKQFKASFEQSPKPCRKVREALAKDTGLSVRVVQVWFQNQRAKMKKIQRKAKNNRGGGANGGDDKDKDKLDKDGIKQEGGSGSGSENGYLGMDSSYATQPLNPNLPFSPDDYPANSNDSFCSSDLSLDGSNFDHLDDDADSLSLNNLELQSSSSSGHHHNSNPQDILANLNNSLINPIDKLYLMQNSYFQGES
ncbi:LIM homeobox transcription factor 1-beta [Lucilia cuprina]|uniref:LIM homeobox transcription factor 1-beta n=1 Tax=Lucilia cuprina TaxID=7375 RepID=UPI001F052723|nr:LIM homeobox transcription factor 1-beta [Lucilia cuprina]